MRALVATLSLLAAAGCADLPPEGPADGDACGSSGLRSLLGQTEAALAAMTLPAGSLRVIRPGDAVTQDYSAERLNIELDASGRITRIHCG